VLGWLGGRAAGHAERARALALKIMRSLSDRKLHHGGIFWATPATKINWHPEKAAPNGGFDLHGTRLGERRLAVAARRRRFCIQVRQGQAVNYGISSRFHA